MKQLGAALSSFVILTSCKSVSGDSDVKGVRSLEQSEGSSIQSPIFDVMEWQKHPGGPLQEPYFLQDQVYTFRIDTPTTLVPTTKTVATYTITDSSGKVLGSGKGTFKVRGYTSRDFPKKQYGFTPVDEKGKDISLPIIDMPAAEDWVLSAPYADKSLLRDVTAYNVGNKLGRHAPRTRIINLVMTVGTQSAQNFGIYVLTEKNTFGAGRIEVPKKNELGTAFQAAFDHLHEGDNVVWSGRDTDVVLEYPSATKITPAQQAEFMTIFNDAEARIAQGSGPAWDTIFNDRLDLDSAVDFFIGQEITRNADGFRLSSGFYIPPKGEKIFFGPLWDFNIAYGNAAHENGIQWNNWRSLEKGVWFGKLLKHPEFCTAVKAKWSQKRLDGSISNGTIFGIIDAHAALIQPYAASNFEKWGGLGQYLWPNAYWLDTYQGEVNALKSWISLRTQWMDTAFAGMTCDGSDPVSFVRDNATDRNRNQFCDEGEACIYNALDLQWHRNQSEPLNHVDAFRSCQSLDKSTGTSGWRLPLNSELKAARNAGIWNVNHPTLLNLSDSPYWASNGTIPGPSGNDHKLFRVNPKSGDEDKIIYGEKSKLFVCDR